MDDFSGTVTDFRIVRIEKPEDAKPYASVMDIEVEDMKGRRLTIKDYHVHEDAAAVLMAVRNNRLESIHRLIYNLRFSLTFD